MELSVIKEDKPPEGAITDKSAFDQVMFLAGSPTVNPEIAQLESEAGIVPTPPLVSLDPNITLAQNETPKPIENATPVPTEEKFDVLDKLLKPQEPTPAVNNEQTSQPTAFTQSQVNEMIAQARAEEAIKWEKATKMIEDFEKNPYEFQSKYTPALVQDLNVEKYVSLGLAKEFGEEFKIIPEEIAIYNSDSNKYLKRQMELETEALSLQRNAKEAVSNTQADAEKQLSELKTSIMNKYGVSDEATFDPMWNEFRGLTKEEVFDRLAHHSLLLRDIDKVKKNIKQPVSRAFATPGITDSTPGASQQIGMEVGGLSDLYSPERLKEYNIIR